MMASSFMPATNVVTTNRVPNYSKQVASVAATNGVPMIFAIPDCSKLWRMPPGSPATLIHIIIFRLHGWHVEVHPSDFIMGVPTSVTLRVVTPVNYYYQQPPLGTTMSTEILDHTCKHVVFHKEQTLGECPVFVPVVLKRSELEAAACIHDNDYVPVRCTMKFAPLKKKKSGKTSKWWCLLRRSFSFLSNLKGNAKHSTNLESKTTTVDMEDSLV